MRKKINEKEKISKVPEKQNKTRKEGNKDTQKKLKMILSITHSHTYTHTVYIYVHTRTRTQSQTQRYIHMYNACFDIQGVCQDFFFKDIYIYIMHVLTYKKIFF